MVPMSLPTSLQWEKRIDLRLDTVFSVLLETAFGDFIAVARNVSEGGMFVETRDPLPLGSRVRIRFQMPDCADDIVATGEVKNHYFLNFATAQRAAAELTGMGIRFLSFEPEGRAILDRHLYHRRVVH
jgi:uncharacterized protein (TIGR02266 family)